MPGCAIRRAEQRERELASSVEQQRHLRDTLGEVTAEFGGLVNRVTQVEVQADEARIEAQEALAMATGVQGGVREA